VAADGPGGEPGGEGEEEDPDGVGDPAFLEPDPEVEWTPARTAEVEEALRRMEAELED
jgi:hypothetical protein